MAFLTLDGTTIPVALSAMTESLEELGQVDRSYSGVLQASIVRRVRSWAVKTPPITSATIATVVGLTGLRTMAGDNLGGSASVRVTLDRLETVRVAGGLRKVASLTIKEV